MTRLTKAWREVQALPEAYGPEGQHREVSVTLGGHSFYAEIEHEKGYTLWYMPGETPLAAMIALRDALNARREAE